MSSFWILLAFIINLINMVTDILLGSIKQFHHLLHRQPYILTLESYIDSRYTILIPMVKGAEKACEMIEDKAEGHLFRLASRMEWFPVKYHLLDKVALVVFTVLGYYTGKHHLDDDLVFVHKAIFYNKYICLVFGADVFGYK